MTWKRITRWGVLAGAVLALSPASVLAAPITVGDPSEGQQFTLDDSQLADTASVELGDVPTVSRMADGDLTTFPEVTTFGSGDQLNFDFSFSIGNGPGLDLLVFELGTAENVNLTVDGQTEAGSLVGLDPDFDVSGHQGFGRLGLQIYGFELDNFGISTGSVVTGPFGLTAQNNTPDVSGIAALNPGNSLQAIPAPASWPLMLLGLLTALGLWRMRGSDRVR